MDAFAGFPKPGIAFLRGLEKNNAKPWFDANRGDYQAHLLEPAKQFVVAMGARLSKLDDDVHAEPSVGGSIFRINRDIRFSKDKTPYKTHLDLWFWTGPDKKAAHSGFFFRMHARTLLLGVGVHEFPKERLDPYRNAVADDETGRALGSLTAKLEKAGYDVGGEHYKKVPKGYDPDHPRARLLRYNALHAGIEMPLPAEVHSAKLVTLCAGHYKKLLPLHQWLNTSV